MTINRRKFNAYAASGLIIGGSAGFLAWQKYTAPIPALAALRKSAVATLGIQQIGLSISALDKFSVESAEDTLLARLALDQETLIQNSELMEKLDKIIKSDYANHDTVNVNQYILSNTEALFVSYALHQQGLEGTVYTTPKPKLKEGIISKETNFGPQITVVGQIFNEQADGHGGIWVQAENTPPGTVITINGNPIKTRWQSSLLTGAVYDEDLLELIARPTEHEVSLLVPATGVYQVLGELTILPRPTAALLASGKPSKTFCEVTDWGTISSNDEDQINVDTLCAPRNTSIYIGETALATTVSPSNVRALLERQVLPTGENQIRLVDSLSGETVILGNFDPNSEPGTK